MKGLRIRHGFFALCAVIMALGGVASASSPDPLRAKARYYYLEGARRQATGETAAAYEMYKKAASIDPAYADAAYAYGINRLSVRTDSMQSMPELRRSLELMSPYINLFPGDFTEARQYAYVASRLDSIGEAIRVYERLDTLRPTDNVTLLLLSDAYMAAHRPQDAIAALDRFRLREGMSPQLSMKKMGILLTEKDTLGAVREADDLVASNPGEPMFLLLRGNLYDVIEQPDSSLSSYLRAESIAPDNGQVKLSLATAYKNRGDSAAYDAKVYEALLSEDFELEDKLGLLGEYLQTLLDDKSNTKRGDHLFEVLRTQFPHEPQVLDLAARYSAAKGDFDTAIEEMSYAIDLAPANTDYRVQKMRFQMAGEHPAEAMETYRRASAESDVPEAMTLMYASAAVQEKKFPEAEKGYAQLLAGVDSGLSATDSVPSREVLENLDYEGLQKASSVYTMLGDMHYQAGALDKAYRAYDAALALFPSNAMALNNYAYFLSENKGDLDKALDMSTKAVELEPDNETYLDTHAWVLFRRKEYGKALEYQEKALERAREQGEPESAEFFSHIGDILFMNHRPYEAVANWKKALELTPDDKLLQKKVKHQTFFFE